jgi:hypothetical protein
MKRSKLLLDLRNAGTVRETRRQIHLLENYYKDPTDMLKELQQRIEQQYMRPMMAELKHLTPRRRRYPKDYPVEFESGKQRRFVMAKLAGKPYRRKGSIARGWRSNVKIEDNKIYFRLDNTDSSSEFVVGKWGLGKSSTQIRRYTQPIQRFHIKTGWKPAYIPVQKWMSRAREDAIATVNEWLRQGLGA